MIDDWTVGEIKDALRAAPDSASLNATARHYARQVNELATSKDKGHRVMAIQIKNLAGVRRAHFYARGK